MSRGLIPLGRRRISAAIALSVIALLGLIGLIAILAHSDRRRSYPAPPHAPVAGPAPAAPAHAAPGLTAPSPARPTPSPPGPAATPAIGASVNRLFNDFSYAPAQINAQLAALESTGATDARSDALWEAAEPNPPVAGVHHYVWSFADLIAGSLAHHHLRWLPIIDYSAPWAQSIPGQDHSAPSSPADYAAYAAAFASRYGAGGSFWREHPEISPRPITTLEIWNEPDGGHFWLPHVDPVGYANLFLATRAAVKAVDPSVRVIIGGLSNAAAFLPALIRSRPQLVGQIGGVAVHPYARTPDEVVAQIKSDRAVLTATGLAGVPLYVTEFGWSPRPRGGLYYLPARLRPRYIEATISQLAHTECGVAGVFLYTWVTPERDPANAFDWLGIHPPHGGSSAATSGFAAGIRAAHSPGPTLRVCAAP